VGSADLNETDVHRATEQAVLAMALPFGERVKLSAAVRGILSVEESSPSERAMLRALPESEQQE
jgi:hypothetical protein